MKKLHLIIAVCICILAAAFCTKSVKYATTWAGTAANQMVTRAALNDAVTNNIFTAKQSFPSDFKMVTKAMVDQYINISPSIYPYNTYASNQLVPKGVLFAYHPRDIKVKCFDSTITTHGSVSEKQYYYAGYVTSVEAFTNQSTGKSATIYTKFNRPLQIGDEVYKVASYISGRFLNWDFSPCTGSFGFFFYSAELNATVELTNDQVADQSVINIFRNVGICVEVVTTGAFTRNVRAVAQSAVTTNVQVTFYIKVNNNPAPNVVNITILSGNTASAYSSITITGVSSVTSQETGIFGFSPTASTTASGTQTYINNGNCN